MCSARRRGSTFIELLVLLGIIAVLVAILVPMFLNAHHRSARFKCTNNLREIGRAMQTYASEHKGRLPSTRPSNGYYVRPDVSNSGALAPDPFGPDGPTLNNVPAAIFLLVREQRVPAWRFNCPGTRTVADNFAGGPSQERSNFTTIKGNLSYAMQNPYPNDAALAAGFKWALPLPPNYPLMADMGPAMAPIPLRGSSAAVPTGNSPNHEKRGQNVLYADFSVDFRLTPLAGVNDDHIYLTRNFKVLESPQDANDSILLPADY
jgi:type II secretory pathway pseudopilin PulG